MMSDDRTRSIGSGGSAGRTSTIEFSGLSNARQNVAGFHKARTNLRNRLAGIRALFGVEVHETLALAAEGMEEHAGEAFHFFEIAHEQALRQATEIAHDRSVERSAFDVRRRQLEIHVASLATELDRRCKRAGKPRLRIVQLALDALEREPF